MVGTLTIEQADVTITMADRTLPYNGQTQSGWSRTDEGKETVTGLANGDTVTITYTPSSGKLVGTYENGAYDTDTFTVMSGTTDVTANYNLTSATAGKLTIEKADKTLKITSADKSWDYDGQTHTYKVYTVTYGDEVLEGTEGQTEFTLSTGDKVTITPTEKGADGVTTVADSGENSFTWAVENEDCYNAEASVPGTLTINARKVTITAKDASKEYDGRALTQPEFTVEGLADGDTHDTLSASGEI